MHTGQFELTNYKKLPKLLFRGWRREEFCVLVQSQGYFATDGQSVSQSVLALNPCGTHDQDTCGFACRGAFSLSRERFCHVMSQSLSVLAIHTYLHFEFL
jgi:hypothetical protein